MGMRRAQHEGIALARAADVVEKIAATGDKAPILDAADRLTDAELLHVTSPPIPDDGARRIGSVAPSVHADPSLSRVVGQSGAICLGQPLFTVQLAEERP